VTGGTAFRPFPSEFVIAALVEAGAGAAVANDPAAAHNPTHAIAIHNLPKIRI
jgi:hypothetical protein